MVFKNKFDAEIFIHMAQDELTRDTRNNVVREFVGYIRYLVDQSRLQLLNLLVSQLQSTTEKEAPPELVDEILDKLWGQAWDVDALFAASLKSEGTTVVRTDVERHSASTAYTAIKDAMAKPLISSHANPGAPSGSQNVSANASTSQPPGTSESELGYMIRAPIAVLATIPLVLGSFVWPWVVRVSKR